MGINFPNTPAVGTLYPSPPVVGQPVYRWDGEKWSVQSLLAKQPIYADGSVPMTAQLTLVAPPVAATDAAAKSYVDTSVAAATAGASTELASKAVRYDAAQVLTDAQQVQARQNVYAAPFDAMGWSGLQLNGSMDIDQANAGTSVVTSGNYVTDGWAAGKAGTWTFSAQQVLDAPPGYAFSLKMSVTAGNGSPAATDYIYVRHVLEGLRTARCRFGTANAQPVSIGFWAKAHRPGTYAATLTNGTSGTRSYPATYVVNVADTWEYKTITIPGDVTGTWVQQSTGISWFLWWTLATGSTLSAPANQWNAGNFVGATGTINGAQAATDTLQITGVVILPGIELPPAARAPYIMRPANEELLACQRYYEKSYLLDVAPGTVTPAGAALFYLAPLPSAQFAFYLPFAFQTSKRIAPTVQVYSPATGAAGKIRDGSALQDVGGTPAQISQNQAVVNAQCFAAATALNMQWHYTADARL